MSPNCLSGSKSHRWSSSGVSILIDNSVEDASAQESASLGLMRGCWLIPVLGRSLVPGSVRSMSVVMIPVLGENVSGMGLIHDQNVIEDFAADRADHSLAVCVHPRRAGRAKRHLPLLSFEDSVEGAGVLAIALAEDEAQRLDTAAEVGEELTPTWAGAARGRTEASRMQDLPHRERRDRVPQPGQLALDPAMAPPWILLRQAQDQLLECCRGEWAAGASPPVGVVPPSGD